MNKILVIAAHPDDEALGCGGTLAKHVSNGDQVRVITIADGEISRDNTKKNKRDKSLALSCKVIGTNSYKSYNLRDNQLDSYPILEIVKIIESEVFSLLPNIIYTHSLSDLNIDHQIVHKAVMTCCRGLPKSSVKKILAFEIPSSTEWNSVESIHFIPDYFVDISDYYHVKNKILEVYKNEMRDFPHTRSLEYLDALSRVRGAQVGVNRAEAFKVLRILE